MRAMLWSSAPFSFDRTSVARLGRFGIVGCASTLVYAAVTLAIAGGALSAAAASVLGYCAGAVVSYSGHKFFTFASAGAHRFELPRFALLTLSGFGFSVLTSALLSDRMGLPLRIPVIINCVAVPAVNYVIMRSWVFAAASPPRDCQR